MTLPIDLNQKENHFVEATLILGDSEIKEVPCKIYLPERNYDKPYVLLKPLKNNADKIIKFWKTSLKADIYGFDKEIKISIEAPEVYFSQSTTKHWGESLAETTVLGEPQDLHIVHHLSNIVNRKETLLDFWISSNNCLTPFMIIENCYNGEVKCKHVEKLEFIIKDDIRLAFEKRFAYKDEKNNDQISWSYLVASTRITTPASDAINIKNAMLGDIDDFLLIASFATSHRTVCLGWTASDDNSLATFYRGNYSFPHPVDKRSQEESIVDKKDFKDFMEICYLAFLCFDNKQSLRRSIQSAIPNRSRTLENSFLTMFAGLEALIMDYNRRQNIEYILSEPVWADFKKYLEKCIKKSTAPKIEKAQRISIYRKLGELNRLSLREAFGEFCKTYALYHADLWPIFSESQEIGLSDIRNKLIHGDPFPQGLTHSLSIACEHLEYTLKRAIVRVLNWDINKTNLNPSYLKAYLTSIETFPAASQELSKCLKKQE
jgi:hypothetical protein